jgi:hypothetical protein
MLTENIGHQQGGTATTPRTLPKPSPRQLDVCILQDFPHSHAETGTDARAAHGMSSRRTRSRVGAAQPCFDQGPCWVRAKVTEGLALASTPYRIRPSANSPEKPQPRLRKGGSVRDRPSRSR